MFLGSKSWEEQHSLYTLFTVKCEYNLCSTIITINGNSLEVQWLALCTFTAEGVQSLVEELRSQKLHGVARKYIYKSKIRCAFYY